MQRLIRMIDPLGQPEVSPTIQFHCDCVCLTRSQTAGFAPSGFKGVRRL